MLDLLALAVGYLVLACVAVGLLALLVAVVLDAGRRLRPPMLCSRRGTHRETVADVVTLWVVGNTIDGSPCPDVRWRVLVWRCVDCGAQRPIVEAPDEASAWAEIGRGP